LIYINVDIFAEILQFKSGESPSTL